MNCKVGGQTFNFGAGCSTLGGGTFKIWPKILIESITYCFRINWSSGDGQKGIKLEAENTPKQPSDMVQAVADAKISNVSLNVSYLSDEIRKRRVEENRNGIKQKHVKNESESTNQEQLNKRKVLA